jgi:hypothetical protein
LGQQDAEVWIEGMTTSMRTKVSWLSQNLCEDEILNGGYFLAGVLRILVNRG